MILKMTDRVMVVLTGLGIKIYKAKKAELEKIYGKTGMPQVVVHDGKSVMRSTLRMLFAMYGDHMGSTERHKRVFVGDDLLFEDLPDAVAPQPPKIVGGAHPNLPRRRPLLIPHSRVIRPREPRGKE